MLYSGISYFPFESRSRYDDHSVLFGLPIIVDGAFDRLQDVVHSEKRLYLVFEYLDLDLKKHMDSSPEFAKDLGQIKVRECFLLFGVCLLCAMNFFCVFCFSLIHLGERVILP